MIPEWTVFVTALRLMQWFAGMGIPVPILVVMSFVTSFLSLVSAGLL